MGSEMCIRDRLYDLYSLLSLAFRSSDAAQRSCRYRREEPWPLRGRHAWVHFEPGLPHPRVCAGYAVATVGAAGQGSACCTILRSAARQIAGVAVSPFVRHGRLEVINIFQSVLPLPVK